MSQPKQFKPADRWLVTADEKARVINLKDFDPIAPNVGIFDEPTRCYRINKEWSKIVMGLVSWLAEISAWRDAENEDYFAIEQIMNFLQGEDCTPPVISNSDCIAYPTYHSSIRYHPSNPYTDPDLVPSGYLLPPFDVYYGGDLFPVNDLYDVTVRFTSLPLFANWFDLIAGAFPEIIITVSGIGEMELKLQNRPFGGRVAITIDRTLNVVDLFVDGLIDTGATFIELNQDITSFPGESVRDFSIELEFDTDTIHEIHLTFVPAIDDSLVPIQFGGVFKGYTLCGLTPVAQGENIVNDVRVSADGCSIEKLVNGVWLDAGSILACITAQTAPLQTQITANDVDILAIQNVNATQSNDIIALYAENDVQDTNIINLQNQANNLQSQVTNNDTDIAALQAVDINHNTRITTNEGDISDNDTDITNLQNQANNLQTQITNNDTDIAAQDAVDSNHNLRITALENAPSGGSGAMLTSVYTVAQSSTVSNSTAVYQELSSALFSHQFTYDTALINLIIRGESAGSGSQYCYTKIRCGGVDSIEKNQVRGGGFGVQDASLAARFMNIDTSIPIDIVPIFKSSTAGVNAKISAKQVVSITIIEYGQGEVVTNEHLVTFDAGGDAFAYDSDTLVHGVGVGGNPDNALIANNFAIGNYLEVDIDLGSIRNIDAVEWQGYSTSAIDTAFYIKIDGVSQGGASLGIQQGNNVWETHDLNDFLPPMTGLVGQVVTIGMGCASNTISEFRFDNLKVNHS